MQSFALGEVNESTANSTIMHRVTEIGNVTGSALALRVAPAALTEFFKDLHLHLESDPDTGDDAGTFDESNVEFTTPSDEIYGDMGNTTTIYPADDAPTGRRRLFWSWFANLMRAVAGAVRSVPVIDRAANWVGGALNGNLVLGSGSPINLRTWTWSGGQSPLPGGITLDLRRSEARLALGVLFNLDIRNWNLQSADLAVRGQTRITAHASVGAVGSWRLDNHLPLLRNVGIGSVTFMVGPVPFNIAGQLDLDVLVEANAGAGVTVAAGATASAMAEAGVTFRNGRWDGLSSHNWAFNRITPNIAARANANAAVTLVPSVSLIAAWIGGPTVSFAPYVASDIRANGGTCNADVGWGVEIQVGARLDVRNPATGRSLGCRGCTHSWGQQRMWATNNGNPTPLFRCSNGCRTCANA